MRLTITIDLDGAAFEDNPSEVSDILRSMTGVPLWVRVKEGAGVMRDSNGNTCGEWKVGE